MRRLTENLQGARTSNLIEEVTFPPAPSLQGIQPLASHLYGGGVGGFSDFK